MNRDAAALSPNPVDVRETGLGSNKKETSMNVIKMVSLKHCPFCGADAAINWVMDSVGMQNGHGGKAIRVSCSREGECPSPSWTEVCNEHEDDVSCLISVSQFWNTRAEDWESEELLRLRVELSMVEQELRVTRIERSRAQLACEQIAKNYHDSQSASIATRQHHDL